MTLDKNDALAIAEALHAAEAEVGPDSPAMKALHDLLYRLAIKYKSVLGLTKGDVTTMSGGTDKNPDDGPK